MKHYSNFDIERERAEQNGTEYKFGALSEPCLAFIPESERESYLPQGELQNIGEEKMDCATRAPLNILSSKFTWLYRNNLLKNRKWLEDNGYVQNSRVDFSDRWIAQNSNTTAQGNSLKAPLQAIRDFGLIPKPLFPQVDSFDEYYDKEKQTQEMKDLGKEFSKRFDIRYEQVADILSKELLKDESLDAAGYAWTVPVNGEYPKPEPYLAAIPNHAFMKIRSPLTYIFDNYLDNHIENDWIKKLASDYVFYDYDYRVYISSETTPEEITIENQTLLVLLKNGLISFFASFLALFTFRKALKTPVVEEKPPKPIEPPPPEPPPLVPSPEPKYHWLTPTAARHSVRVLCDECGLTVAQKNLVSSVINCESGFRFNAKHENVVNGKVTSTDWGIVQINDYWHIGQGKSFPSVEYVINNPEKCVRWMIDMFKTGKLNLWVCYSSKLYESFDA